MEHVAANTAPPSKWKILFRLSDTNDGTRGQMPISELEFASYCVLRVPACDAIMFASSAHNAAAQATINGMRRAYVRLR